MAATSHTSLRNQRPAAIQTRTGNLFKRLLSGILSTAGFLALFVENAVLNMALVAGGAVYWLALFPLSYALLRGEAEQKN